MAVAWKNLLSRIEPAKTFLVLAIVLQTIYTLVSPPFQSPDEYNHFYRTIQIAQGGLMPVNKDQRLGGEMPACVDAFMLPYRIMSNNPAFKWDRDIWSRKNIGSCACDTSRFRDFPNTALYSPVSYLPQVAAVVLFGLFQSDPAWLWFGGRLAIFLVWLFCMYRVIQILPAYKWTFVLLLLLPMHIQQTGTFNADVVTNILCFLFMALALRACALEESFKRKHLVVLALITFALVFTKVVYASVVLMLFAVPPARFGNRRVKWIYISVLVIATVSLVLMWSSRNVAFHIPYKQYNVEYRDHSTLNPQADYFEQKAILAANPSLAFPILWKTLLIDPVRYLKSYIGEFGTYMGVALPENIVSFALIVLTIIAVLGSPGWTPSLWQRTVFVITFLVMASLLVLTYHLSWNTVGRDSIDAIQGRYFTPIIPLLLIALPLKRKFIPRLVPVIALVAVVVLNFSAVKVLSERYIVPSRDNVLIRLEEFEEDVKPPLNRSVRTARRGRGSLMVLPADTVTLIDVPDLRPKDLLDVYGWRKGRDGSFWLHGDCEQAYGNSEVHYVEKGNWGRMNMSFETPEGCPHHKFELSLINPGPDTVYFDDVGIAIRRCK